MARARFRSNASVPERLDHRPRHDPAASRRARGHHRPAVPERVLPGDGRRLLPPEDDLSEEGFRYDHGVKRASPYLLFAGVTLAVFWKFLLFGQTMYAMAPL